MDILLHLAPLAGISDAPFRRVCRRFGADIVCTEMISSRGIFYKDKKTASLLDFSEDEQPVGIQLFGCEPEIMAYAAKTVEERNPAFIDINMGCPMPKIVGSGDGAALMKNLPLAGKIIEAVASAVSCPVTVKFRSGYTPETINAVELAVIAENSGAKKITVHPRTRDQFYGGTADRSVIRAVREAVKIPVVANGDIFSPESAAETVEITGCRELMLARGAFGNPFLFTYIKDYFNKGFYTPFSADFRLKTALSQVREMCGKNPERVAVAEARKHLAWYLKGLPGSAKIRDKIMKASSYNETERIISEYLPEIPYSEKTSESRC